MNETLHQCIQECVSCHGICLNIITCRSAHLLGKDLVNIRRDGHAAVCYTLSRGTVLHDLRVGNHDLTR